MAVAMVVAEGALSERAGLVLGVVVVGNVHKTTTATAKNTAAECCCRK